MKILVVEDDTAQRLLVKRMILQIKECEVFEAKDGVEGLRVVEIENPDLVFTDLWMPVMNGITMLERIRHRPEFKTLPVVVMSALNDKETVGSVVQLGVSGYLLKPITQKQIEEKLLQFLEHEIQK